MDADLALEALHELCCAGIDAAQRRRPVGAGIVQGAVQERLSIKHLIPLVLCGDHAGIYGYSGSAPGPTDPFNLPRDISEDKKTGEIHISPDRKWSKEHLDSRFDYDFTKLKDTETYFRGGEQYKRPYGWTRFSLKVLGEYEDDIWLGNQWRSTQSVDGEWPVSYHGTRQECVQHIIEDNYKAGPRAAYGRGVYSTPNLDVAEQEYAKKFTSKKTNKEYKAVLQNRINPKHRTICMRKDYWLVKVPNNATDKEEHEIVSNAIRPYGLLLKEV